MNYQELSQQYFICCDEIQRLTVMLYEEIHDEEGRPRTNWEAVIDKVKSYRQGVQAETEAIITACEEHNEAYISSESQGNS
tara:strand:+ start:2390 stop:2632 length:243 start_codon:yes stop_codon:yes gene_type:complete